MGEIKRITYEISGVKGLSQARSRKNDWKKNEEQPTGVWQSKKKIKKQGGYVSKETVVLRRWESMAGNLVLTTENIN